ncbi:peptidoglycan hydrolase-like protein with peptidoglycan-binding domain [Dyadobacter sp. BE34]|uniref:Peptidoglycan hydrolase-like protein with peptidoglycan-binding domain n=1 Tax=Dyadobacter fermentans TaxID=94254 RepID=A0ABU1R004_9BACT|nr:MULTISPECIES: hypothetical protein [Dyadobacter]MDR6806733.1 peptidoglycan hydrolase-like protein with peptidoglycan-binding domain [Dyadobacter fermentans]MDR7044475.1 peptidoglycan hydrolase-like protein with peptidoglycan-binding domain [Dyadobacter sp. BE242]MDR7198785.1 peptidoglycan hydrolase-like protein with peptidoglycan-binding domain [Dyadobacter sp. BE34]MDR7216747.1 peptidoglycan hydrolase-like protein with peptidoglycan-binding domain [Dyadobacter sp. BE31]MDR7263727.1 peptido
MQSPFIDFVPETGSETGNEYENIDQMLAGTPIADFWLTDDEDFQTESSSAVVASGEQDWDLQDLYSGEALLDEEVNLPKAIEWNDRYAAELRWSYFEIEINALLGYPNSSPTQENFAYAVAEWQRANDLYPADGMLGPSTWMAMLKTIIRQTSFSHVNLKTAAVANEKLAKILGWEKFELDILKVLGFHNESPNQELFAKAVALWQPKLGFKGTMIDGRLGEKTWAAIRTFVLAEVEKSKKANAPTETAVSYTAYVKGNPGIYLHDRPGDAYKRNDVMYPHGERVTVTGLSTIATEQDWVKISTQKGQSGWIQKYHLATPDSSKAPDPVTVKTPPGAYLVKKNDALDTLVKRFYPNYEIEIGNDRRTIIHAFSILNADGDALDYQGQSTTWWRNHVLDRDMAETRTIYETIRLRENRFIYFPNETYIQMLRDSRIVGVRPDWKNAAIIVGKSIVGFLEGVKDGFIDSAIDTVKGLWDFIKSIFTGELFEQLYDLYKEFSELSLADAASAVWQVIMDIVGEKVDEIRADLNAIDPRRKLYSIGKLVGWILFEVVIFILTSGASVPARFAAKFRKIEELLSKSAALMKIRKVVSAPALKKAINGFSKAQDYYEYIELSHAVFGTIDSIKEVSASGMELFVPAADQEMDYEFEDWVETEDVELGLKTGGEAEELVRELLINDGMDLGDGVKVQMDHVLPGQYNGSGHGIDLIGFSVSGGRVRIYVIEVKGGRSPKLGMTLSGPQMSAQWIEHAIDKAFENDTLKKALIENFRFYKDVRTMADIKRLLLTKAERRLIVSKSIDPKVLESFRKALKNHRLRKVKLIVKETAELLDNLTGNEPQWAEEDEAGRRKPKLSLTHAGKTYSVLDPATNKKCTTTNASQITKSGIPLADIKTKLGQSVDLNVIGQLLGAYNSANAASPFDVSTSTTVADTVFTEAVHQFQIANYLAEADQDGILGPSTFETLEFFEHKLKSALNSAGFYGQGQLNRAVIKSRIGALTNNEFSAANWFKYIVKPAWLGVKLTDGVHLLLYRKMKEAEQWLLNQTAYKGLTPAALGKALGFNADTRYSAARLSKEKEALHGFGLAIDIHAYANPWIGAGWVQYDKELLKERVRMIQALRNAAGNQSLPGANIFEYLHSIAQAHGDDTRAVHRQLKTHSDEFIDYLRRNASELAYWRASATFSGKNPLNGFLNLHTDLVYALRQIAGLAWGATDFGPGASGDIMHFDLRTIGIGQVICENIGGYVPVSGHPTITHEYVESEQYDSPDNEMQHREAVDEATFYGMESGYAQTAEYETDGPEWEDLYDDIENQVKDFSKAIAQNRRYANSLGWGAHYDAMNALLLPLTGSSNVSLGEEAFAEAVSQWQLQQGFSQAGADGIVGPVTWARMKAVLGITDAPAPPTQPATPGNIFDTNRQYAQTILDIVAEGFVQTNRQFGSKDQLGRIVGGLPVHQVNPQTSVIKALPIIAHICECAKAANFKDIVIGSFIRKPSDGKCTGHCVGRCIDINFRGGSFESARAVEMVVNILNYLTSLPAMYKKGLGFGLPLQGDFFGRKSLKKFSSVSSTLLIDSRLSSLVSQLGYVFPDNDNHLHIQVS